MSDTNFREIQLSTKHVVFLFMAGVVAAVAIFLLGVSVGRRVTPDLSMTATDSTLDPITQASGSGLVPPPTVPQPGDLQYQNDLQGRGEAKTPPAPPTPSADAPDPSGSPVPTPTPQVAAAAPTEAKPTAPTTDAGYFVQVDSFASKANADRQIARLKAKGVAAFLFTAPGSGARYKVRLGPFPDRGAADAMVDRLKKEGLRPSVIR